MRLGSVFSLAAALLSATVQAYGNPGACSGQCWSHDPSVVRRDSDGTYFRFETGSKIGIWKAPDLVGPWTYQGAALPSGSKINLKGNDDLWAPDVNKVGDQYILYYTVSSFGVQDSAIGYATSPTMEYGSWTDHGATGVASKAGSRYNAIDANLVQTGGNYYLNFGSFWSDIFQVPMTNGGVKANGNPYNIILNTTAPQPVEGAFVYERSGTFWAFFSSGSCCGLDSNRPSPGNEYKIFVCRATSVAGPYTDKSGKSCTAGGGTLLLPSHDKVYAPGGQGVLVDPKRGAVLYYHYMNTDIGYADSQTQFGWNIISWSGGWPSV
ncbi:putative arabinan endo-1,5-alpha-L-arabinosidase A [Colletotrichum sp. SAR 10_70]|nr:putative arabinan endo-1,5-alpha-L-arabinosidase A [Colletotrichum sp. SAR 10_71]KAI8173670.1 putative arabinan endo-1,5-alpha-L-arabinosidase A [Colletotrichum sp. SAR 10_70]KAI8223501.1 putative arabinan endo-1,5-alpha-L-arabinosidase A [Colletotrichum sp. SAR 10_86]KAJ4999351.1 putative arabinan endo-1,5-alpha-L-arabinosidase A [Colletotrichum sp. SAR 10_66]